MSLSHLMRITYPRLHFSMLQCHLHHRIVGEGAHPIGGTITTKDEVTTTIIDTNILQVNLLLFSSRAELIKASFMFHRPILFLICGLHLVKPNRTRLLLSSSLNWRISATKTRARSLPTAQVFSVACQQRPCTPRQ